MVQESWERELLNIDEVGKHDWAHIASLSDDNTIALYAMHYLISIK